MPGQEYTVEQWRRELEFNSRDVDFASLYAEDDTAGSLPAGPPEPGATPPGAGAGISAFFRRAGEVWRSLPEQTQGDRAIEVGAKKAVNEAADVLTWAATRGESSTSPFRFDVPEERASGAYGFLENAAQFAGGFVTFSKILKPVQVLGTAGRAAAAGFLTDAVAFDPHEERLSNLIQAGPEWARNPLTEFLAADEDDGEAAGRVKAGLEGLLTGAAVDGVLWSARAVRASRLVKTGKLPAEEGERIVSEAAENARKALEDTPGILRVSPEPDGRTAVTLDASGARTAGQAGAVDVAGEAAPRVVFDTAGEAQSFAASVEDALRADQRPRASLSPEQVAHVVTIRDRITSGMDPQDTARLLEGINFNFSRVAGEDDAKALVNALSEAFRPAFEAGAKPRGWEEMMRLADGAIPGLSREEAAEAVAELAEGTADLDVRLFASRQLFWGMAREVEKLSTLADVDFKNPVRVNELGKALDTLLRSAEALAGSKRNVARGLASLRKSVDGGAVREAGTSAARQGDEAAGGAPNGTGGDAPAVPRSLAGMDGRDIRALARQIRFAGGDPDKILRLLGGAQKASDPASLRDDGFWKRLLSFRVEMMLSGPKTHLVNALSNAATAVQVPAEFWWAGVRSGNGALRQEGGDMLVGHLLYLRDAMAAASKAFQMGDNVLDPGGRVLDTAPGSAAPGAGWLSTLVHAPSRMLLTSDEFFKQLNYRSHVRAQALRHAREQGITDPAELARRVSDDLAAAFDVDGAGISGRALDVARYATFSNDLGKDTLGEFIQQGAQRFPLLRIVFPFVRTPVNVFRFAWERTPYLNRFMATHRADLAAGGERAAIAQARHEAGLFMYSTAATLAAMGMLTGGGPKDPKLRALWLQAGHQPYSVRLPDGSQLSYRRAEPIATPLGMVADFLSAVGELGEDDAETMLVSLPAAMASSVSSKTFLQGMVEFFDAVASGAPHKVERALSSFAGSFVPNVARQINPDPVYREVDGVWQEIQSRIPGWSEELEPRRNILGEPVAKAPGYFNRSFNPLTAMGAPDDSLALELLELGRGLSMPAEKIAGGRIDLRDRATFDNGTGQSPYDRWMALVAEPAHGGPNLRAALEERMRSATWQEASTGTDLHPGGRRFKMAARVVDIHQQRAFNAMLREFPKLRAAMQVERRERAASFRSSELVEAVNR